MSLCASRCTPRGFSLGAVLERVRTRTRTEWVSPSPSRLYPCGLGLHLCGLGLKRCGLGLWSYGLGLGLHPGGLGLTVNPCESGEKI